MREVQIIFSLDHILYIILEDIHVLGIKIIFEYNLNPLSNNIKLAYTKNGEKYQQKDIVESAYVQLQGSLILSCTYGELHLSEFFRKSV